MAGAITSVPAGHHTDRRGALRVLTAGAACFALVYAGFAATDASIPLLAACFALAGIGIGCAETAEHAAVASIAPEQVRSSAFGVLAGVRSLGNLAASALAGLLYTVASPTVAFAYAASLMGVALIVLATIARRRPQQRAPHDVVEHVVSDCLQGGDAAELEDRHAGE